MNNRFDINSIINKADAKDRAIIFFDEILNGLIQGKRKFSETQIESLSNSFKGNFEKDLFNDIQHNSLYSLFIISQVEKEIMSIEYLTAYLRFYNSSQNDKSFINYLISKSSEDFMENKNISDKKQIKNIFNELSKQVNDMCFISFGDDIIKKFVEKNYTKNEDSANDNYEIKNKIESKNLEEKSSDLYHKKFFDLFTNSIENKTNSAKEILNEFKNNYKEFKFKFEAIESKINDLEERILDFEKFIMIRRKI
jgi:hypothetical protein